MKRKMVHDGIDIKLLGKVPEGERGREKARGRMKSVRLKDNLHVDPAYRTDDILR